MTWAEIEQHWAALIPTVMQRWPGTTEEDLIATSGERDALIREVHGATDLSAEDAARDVDQWAIGPMPADAVTHPMHDMESISEAGRYVPEGEDVYADDARFGDDNQADRPIGRDG